MASRCVISPEEKVFTLKRAGLLTVIQDPICLSHKLLSEYLIGDEVISSVLAARFQGKFVQNAIILEAVAGQIKVERQSFVTFLQVLETELYMKDMVKKIKDAYSEAEGNLLEGFESPEGSVDGVSTPGELHATMSRHYNGGRQSNAYTSKSAPCGKKDIDNTNHTKSAPLTGTDVLLFTKGIEKSQNRKSIKPPVPLPPPVIVVEKGEEIIRDQPVVASIPAAPTLPHSDQAVKLLSKKSSEASYSSARSQCSSSSKHIYETIAEQDCNGTGSSVSLACLPGESEHSDRDISPSPRPSFSLPEYTTTAMDPPRIPRNDNPNAELPYNNWLHGTVERELPHDTAEGACSTAKLTAKKTTPPANLKVESPRKKSFLAKLGFRRDKKKHADSSKPHSDSSSNVLKTEPPYDRAKSISSPDFSLPEELFFPLDTSKNSSICNV